MDDLTANMIGHQPFESVVCSRFTMASTKTNEVVSFHPFTKGLLKRLFGIASDHTINSCPFKFLLILLAGKSYVKRQNLYLHKIGSLLCINIDFDQKDFRCDAPNN